MRIMCGLVFVLVAAPCFADVSSFEADLPGSFKFMTRGLGTRETKSPDFLSLVLFQPDYICALFRAMMRCFVELNRQATEIGLDLPVELPRPRSRGSARLAALEAEVLNRVLAQPELPPQPEPVSPLPTQLRWAL